MYLKVNFTIPWVSLLKRKAGLIFIVIDDDRTVTDCQYAVIYFVEFLLESHILSAFGCNDTQIARASLLVRVNSYELSYSLHYSCVMTLLSQPA